MRLEKESQFEERLLEGKEGFQQVGAAFVVGQPVELEVRCLGFEGLECEEERSYFGGKALQGRTVGLVFDWGVVLGLFMLFLLEHFDDIVSHFFEFFIPLQVLQQFLLAVGAVIVCSESIFLISIVSILIEDIVHGTAIEKIQIFHYHFQLHL